MVGRQVVVEEGQQIGDLVRKVLDTPGAGAVDESLRGAQVGARRAADAQVDAPREQRLEHPEGLGHLERAIVGEKHPA
jgi:hypothetical protein